MDFFKAVFSDDPDPPKPGSVSGQSVNASQSRDHEDPDRHPFLDDHESDQIPKAEGDSSITSSGWSFGGLIRNLTSKSESVIETYRRDLQEFGSGLRKELEVAQGSLGTVGSAIDELGNSVLKGTAQMIAQGKDAILAVDHESDSDNSSSSQNVSGQWSRIYNRYDRFDAQVRFIQNDVSTYSLEPEDVDDYNKWRSEFSLEEKSKEIKGFLEENDAILSFYKELVPNNIDSETFWFRYFYKVFKLKQAEDLRAKLVKRVISKEEEELSWDVDDDEDAGRSLDSYAESKNSIVEKGSSSYSGGESTLEKSENLAENKTLENDGRATIKIENSVGDSKSNVSIADEKVEKIPDSDTGGGGNDGGATESSVKKGLDPKRNGELSENEAGTESNDNVTLGRRDDLGESKTEDKEVSMVSRKPSIPEEEDLEWDEIEDLNTLDDKKPTKSGSPQRADLRKRLSAAEEEDLTWDIEDDDEPAKS